jgi:hypothetical protein
MAASSLVVRISADINDFSRNLNKMTKDVRKAADQVADIGKTLTLGITLPAGLAAVALSKMGLENEAVAGKMRRTFGGAVDNVNHMLERMMKIVPETMTELQKMAIATTDFGEGLGMAAPKAALLTEQMMKMAADLSSKKMIAFGDALDIVQKGLSGQTRGLKQVGIIIDQAQIKQEAYRLGLLKTGQELTPLGTALASYSLMVKQWDRVQGDANASINDAGRQLAFAKRDLMEFFDATSNLLIPALRVLAKVLTAVVNALNKLPDWLRQTIIVFTGLLAVLGPTLIIIARITQAIITLKTAMTLLATGSTIAKIIGALAAPEVLLVLGAIAAALGIGIALWKKYHKEAAGTDTPKLDPLADVRKLFGGATSANMDSPLQRLQKQAAALSKAFDLSVNRGDDLTGILKDVLKLNQDALEIYDAQADKFGEMALAAREVAKQMQMIAAVQIVRGTFDIGKGGMFSREFHMQNQVSVQSRRTTTDEDISRGIAKQMISDETSLRTREAVLSLPPVFNSLRVASVELGEKFRAASQDFSKSLSSLKLQVTSMSGLKDAAVGGFQAGMAGILDSIGPFALVMTAIGKIFQGFQPVLDKLLGPLVALGQIIATMLTPILKVLFVPLKLLGIVVAFLGEIVARVTAAIATAIATVLTGIGKALNMIPFLHLGNGLIAAGNALSSFAKDQYATADELKKQRKQLQDLKFDDAANGLNNLADATNNASDAIINAANTFKLNLAKYNARDYDSRAPLNLSAYYPQGTGGGSAPSGLTPGGTSTKSLDGKTPLANLMLDGKVVAQVTVDHLRTAASRQYGDSSRIKDVVIIGS